VEKKTGPVFLDFGELFEEGKIVFVESRKD
jgi:hypothetical protein